VSIPFACGGVFFKRFERDTGNKHATLKKSGSPLHVPGRGCIGTVGCAIAGGVARIVHGELLSSQVDGIAVCPLPDFLCGDFYPISQECSQSFSFRYLFREGDNRLMISPGELTPLCIILGKHPVFVAFNGKCNGSPYRNGVKSCTITDIVNLDYGLKVIIEAERSKGTQGFIFRFVCFTGVRCFLDRDFTTACNGTAKAGIFLFLIGCYALIAYGSCVGKIFISGTGPVFNRCLTTRHEHGGNTTGTEA